jgi:hypothetical protein
MEEIAKSVSSLVKSHISEIFHVCTIYFAEIDHNMPNFAENSDSIKNHSIQN